MCSEKTFDGLELKVLDPVDALRLNGLKWILEGKKIRTRGKAPSRKEQLHRISFAPSRLCVIPFPPHRGHTLEHSRWMGWESAAFGVNILSTRIANK